MVPSLVFTFFGNPTHNSHSQQQSFTRAQENTQVCNCIKGYTVGSIFIYGYSLFSNYSWDQQLGC